MTDQILVPLDGSEKAYEALEYAIEKRPGAEITVLHAMQIMDDSPAEGTVIMMDEGMLEAAENRAEDIFAEARERAEAAGYEAEIESLIEDVKPKQAIVERAADFDTVVMGSYGREGVGQKLLGSVAETVVRRCSVPVTVVR